MSDLTIMTGLSWSQGTSRDTQEMLIIEQVGQAWEMLIFKISTNSQSYKENLQCILLCN